MGDHRWYIKVTSKGQVTLPKEAREAMMIREGDYLEASLKDNALSLIKRSVLSDSEQTRLYAQRWLEELGYGDPASRAELDPVRFRETLPPLPDMTQLIRKQREEE
ncbi:MAG: AbrB/MazE/SpoVT family DNA-binding domain-containing protein [Bacillota bacterium]